MSIRDRGILISSSNATEEKNILETIPQNKPPSIMGLAFLGYLGRTILEVIEKHVIVNYSHLIELKKIQEIFKMIHMMFHYI
ncbi:hypothetical protein OKW24_003976 [Peribacillus simplex]|uniref:hypothetical protein n=1 Tax=Peribacillus simplex TaxID=1478 RepID=UPI0024E238E8|nr:hypothetical protein [Peribacillus simplex]MDF9762203.1 hypothetical protein [Peribacillus simplex]